MVDSEKQSPENSSKGTGFNIDMSEYYSLMDEALDEEPAAQSGIGSALSNILGAGEKSRATSTKRRPKSAAPSKSLTMLAAAGIVTAIGVSLASTFLLKKGDDEKVLSPSDARVELISTYEEDYDYIRATDAFFDQGTDILPGSGDLEAIINDLNRTTDYRCDEKDEAQYFDPSNFISDGTALIYIDRKP